MLNLLEWLDRLLDDWPARGTQTLLLAFLESVHDRRRELGLSVNELAEKAGLRHNCLQRMVADPSAAKVEHMVCIASALGMKLTFRLEERE